jgi:DNA transformation protein
MPLRRSSPSSSKAATTESTAIDEMFSALGAVSVRRMFGAKGVYHRGLIIAIDLRGEMLLKADAVSAPEFEAAGARRWVYEGKGGKVVPMPYWTVPDEAFDDPDLMARWVRLAYEAALRAPPK